VDSELAFIGGFARLSLRQFARERLLAFIRGYYFSPMKKQQSIETAANRQAATSVRYLRQQGLPEFAQPVCVPAKVLVGQKAVVTGANSGIGRAIARALGQAGADVVINYHSHPDAAEEVVRQIENDGARAFAHRCDVSKESEVRKMFARLIREWGTFDILVNNAGIEMNAPFDEMTLEQWNRVLAVNLTGPFLCAREAVREFKRRGVRPEISCAAGKIICISSVHDVIPWAGRVNYASSKAGMLMMLKSLAQEVAAWRIRVNGVSPGAIRTPINEDAWSTPRAYAELMKLVPSKRIGEPDEIGRAVVWLASDASDYIQGTTVYVDGGMTLYPGFDTGG
jgi:glucose 1-dehydrogenase